jgi:hypothetical protein
LTSIEGPNGFERALWRSSNTARLERELAAVRAQTEETTRQLAELRAMMPKQQSVAVDAKPRTNPLSRFVVFLGRESG